MLKSPFLFMPYSKFILTISKLSIPLFLALILIVNLANSATLLEPGDIAFVGINSDGDDDFAFVLLKDITAGTSIFVSDKGWNDGAGFYTSPGDGVWEWSTTFNLSAGQLIYIKTTNNGVISPTSLVASPGTIV